ncbi:16S rRNA (adenine(1518)-N(6)/adenine(1519)-N(6))-dimethyltransferaseRsmA [soil metagenome]
MTAQTRTHIRGLLDRHGIVPRPSLGQNFLADPNVIDRVVRTAEIQRGDRVLEVGPGTGALTRALAATGAIVTAIEFDNRLEPVLVEELDSSGVTLLWADAMEVDYSHLLQPTGWKAVANLPYQIGTPLLLDWLRFVPALIEFTLMVQLEVAQRLIAKAGNDAYGLPSVVVGLHAKAELAFKVPPQVFYPAPRVESAVVRMIRQPSPLLAEEAIRLAAGGFGQRRKMLRGALSTVLERPIASLEAAGIDPKLRAEDLSPEDFLRLAEFA